MPTFRRAACGLFLLARLGGAEEAWHATTSANFELTTNASPERGESIVLTLERFREALGQVLPELRRWTSRPTRLYAFRDRESLEPFLPRSGPNPSRVAGYLRTDGSENVIVLDLEGGIPAFERVLFHEYVHLALSLSDRPVPLWLGEGLAEFYAGTRLGDREAEVGVPDARHRALLARSPLFSLPELVTAEDAGDDAPLFYARSWALIHYLLVAAPDGRERLADYLERSEKGGSPLAAFRDAFSAEPGGMEEALQEHLDRMRSRAMKVALQPSTPSSAVSRPLSAAEVLERRGELFLAASRQAEARAALEDALQLAPDLGSAWEALGLLEWEEGKPELAARSLEKAIELDSASGRGLYRYAEILLADYRSGIEAIPAPLAAKAGAALKKALALEPSARGPAELLAFLYLVRGVRLEEAQALIAGALTVAPSDPSLLFLEAQLLAKRGDYQKARETLEHVAGTAPDPRLREEVEKFLARLIEAQKAPGR